jgi:hypothetical protein
MEPASTVPLVGTVITLVGSHFDVGITGNLTSGGVPTTGVTPAFAGMLDGNPVNATQVLGTQLVVAIPPAQSAVEGYIALVGSESRGPRQLIAHVQELVNMDNGTFRCPGDCVPEQQLYRVDMWAARLGVIPCSPDAERRTL